MKVTIVTCFESNEERVSFVCDTCKKANYDVEVITTNFSHINKSKRTNIPNDYIALNTKPYNKNLSISRMLSHYIFAKDAFSLIEKQNPDLIWLMAPANSLIKQANLYKQKHKNVKIVVDIVDMWPESLPTKFNNVFPFSLWKNIRKNNIKCADALVTECDLYQDILKDEYKNNLYTIHWARDEKPLKNKLNLSNDKLSLCYIGSINNIIDIDLMKQIITNVDKDVVLHVIGDGENKGRLISELSTVCEVNYHGVIRDQKEKNEVFNMCHAGLNIYREGLYIGLTVKCIDYFENGLPIINNIKGDTWKFVENNKVGINISKEIKINPNDLINMRLNNKNIYDLYNSRFTKEIFEEKCLKVINEV